MKFSSKIAIPLQPRTMKECRLQIKKAQKSADIIEIWLDHISDLDLEQLMKWQNKPFLLVNKAKKEQGTWKHSEAERVEILKTAAQLGAKYIDVGIHTNPKLIKDLISTKKKSTQIIISHHDFQKTPSLKQLQQIIKKIQIFKPDIIKIATFAKNNADSLRLLDQLNFLQQKKMKAIILGMGEHGKLTRIFGCYLGNFLTFTPLDPKKATAPGQISLSALQKISKIV